MTDLKQALRRQFRQIRDALASETRLQFDQAILEKLQDLPEIQSARSLFSYVSVGSETDTRPLLDWLLDRGTKLAVPAISNQYEMCAVAFTGWSNMVRDKAGIPSPVPALEVNCPIDICITPGLAFTVSGTRLGQGQGNYDRWFATHQVGLKIALAYECQLVQELPWEQTDIGVEMIVTEQRVIRVSLPLIYAPSNLPPVNR